ncbi:MAG: 16S rRNA (adenine(1518)-N(6)/adenine(1519)-N(6))-dimethyltransferase RsmA [Bacteroidales bacterium]|nr:16S rRNA (adenine(1518)-N(6)/adenine(1519)-N(6))-dimethyltransferase RsmA [Bacteroidales bacterium]
MVRPKKHLGQHFLKDNNIAQKIVNSIDTNLSKNVIEIGPGMGILTDFLVKIPDIKLSLIEIDSESVDYLKNRFKEHKLAIIQDDFIKPKVNHITENCLIIGNFPYNISSQIFFKILENKENVIQVVGMIQKEVAERLKSPPGNKTYGILSVLLQAYYDIDYLFTVNETVFVPPPKVKSAVIRISRNNRLSINCNEQLFFQVVKMAFNQRRKTLRNSLKKMLEGKDVSNEIFSKRPEQLSVDDFIFLTQSLDIIKAE